MSLRITTRRKGDVTVFDCKGKIVFSGGVSILHDTIRAVAEEGEIKQLLNMSGVTQVDESGVGEMVSGFTHLKNQNGNLKLLNPSKRFRDLLSLTKLDVVFETYEEEDKAISSFMK